MVAMAAVLGSPQCSDRSCCTLGNPNGQRRNPAISYSLMHETPASCRTCTIAERARSFLKCFRCAERWKCAHMASLVLAAVLITAAVQASTGPQCSHQVGCMPLSTSSCLASGL